jgi:hypothetical protein
MAKKFIEVWLKAETPHGAPQNLVLLTEQPGQRSQIEKAIHETVLDHLVGADIVESMGGFQTAANVIRNAMPVGKRARSGDFGEILATEYVDQTGPYRVPIRRLRFRDDRSMAMRGDDVLGFDFGTKPLKILKAEAKSRISLSSVTAKEACDGLCRHLGRPNPHTLSFISRRLRETGQPDLAAAIEGLQETDISLSSLTHLIFTVSSNNPVAALSSVSKSPIEGIGRQVAGCIIEDHAAFIEKVFDSAMKGMVAGGIS